MIEKKYNLVLSEKAAKELIYLVDMGLIGFCFFSDLTMGKSEDVKEGMTEGIGMVCKMVTDLGNIGQEIENSILALQKELEIK